MAAPILVSLGLIPDHERAPYLTAVELGFLGSAMALLLLASRSDAR